MSLVPTFVKADNGKWYKDPTLGQSQWFICFDDDDPPEFVFMKIFKGKNIKLRDAKFEAQKILTTIFGLFQYTLGKIEYGAERVFDEISASINFCPAYSSFIEIEKPIPAKFIRDHNGIFQKQPQQQGVYYGFENTSDLKELNKPTFLRR